MKAYKEITDVIFDLDGVAALLNALSLQYSIEDNERLTTSDMFRALSKLQQDIEDAADFLSTNEIIIDKALRGVKNDTKR